jgi:hypothetical protein
MRTSLGIASVLVAAVGATAVGSRGAAAPTAEAVLVESRTGEVARRPIEELAQIDLAKDVAFVRFERAAAASAPRVASVDRARIELTNGDRVLGKLVSGSGDRIQLELESGVALALDVDSIAEITFEGRLTPDQRASLRRPPQGDLLYTLRDGALDRIEGTLEEFQPDGVRFESRTLKKRVTTPWNEVAGLFIEALDRDRPQEDAKGAGVRVIADLADGGRLRGRCLELAPGGCRLALRSAEIALPLDAIDELFVDSGELVFLSDLAPSKAVEGSLFGDDFGLAWPHRVDRSVTGAPLVVGGRTYRRGIGVHAPSRISWALDGSYKELRGFAGIDDQVLTLAEHGAVNFKIHGDGKLLWESRTVRGGEAPRAISGVALSGVKELALEVDPDAESFVADRADWLRLLLVR